MGRKTRDWSGREARDLSGPDWLGSRFNALWTARRLILVARLALVDLLFQPSLDRLSTVPHMTACGECLLASTLGRVIMSTTSSACSGRGEVPVAGWLSGQVRAPGRRDEISHEIRAQGALALLARSGTKSAAVMPAGWPGGHCTSSIL
jgi:hypothetical protein